MTTFYDYYYRVITGIIPTTRAIIAGSGLSGGGDLSADRTLDVNVDGSTIEISSDTLRVKDGGITSAKITDGTIATGDLAFTPVKSGDAAGGALDGTYPNPGLAASVAGAGLAETSDVLSVNVDGSTLEINSDSLRVKALGITDAQVAAANKDGAAGTASMRTLGTGATQAAGGTDSRLSDSRAPNGSAGGDLTGTYPNPTLATAGPGATGPIGDATHTPVVTIDAKGRVTALTSALISAVSGVASIAKSGATALTGAVTLTGGTGVTLTQVGQDISIAASGGGAASDGWVDDTAETWTYASGSGGGTATFTVPTDLTAKYSPGTRIKLTQTTVKYFVVASSSFASSTTTVTITAGSSYTLANAAISANYHSYMGTPQGYPGIFTYTLVYGGFSSDPASNGTFHTVGRLCTVAISISGSGTSNATTFTVNIPLPVATTMTAQWMLAGEGRDNGTTFTTPPQLVGLAAGTSTLNIYKSPNQVAWSSSGLKYWRGTFSYVF